jgi:hypothetical protein
MKATATACHRLQVLWKEPEDDHAVAACHRGGAPDNSGNPRQARRQSLNNKLRALAMLAVAVSVSFPEANG